jgi:laminin, alpha 1/2
MKIKERWFLQIFRFTERNFNFGKYLELELEFRTSDLNGILVSIAEPVGFPALSLELNNGNVS